MIDIKQVLEMHRLWLQGQGRRGSRADLSHADLSDADLSGADLSRADLSGADLSRAYLSRADLIRADLSHAYLSGADLSHAYLSGADLSGAYLSRADLSRADLSLADLSGADLSGADLSRADLSGADLSGAVLSGADLSGAVLSGADLSGACMGNWRILPDEGTIVGWKKLSGGVICKLQINAADAVCSLVGRKCRARAAVVMEGKGRSSHDLSFTYAPGQTLTVPNFDDDIRIECAPGIHFFITKKEAQEY
jgi:uncharacterized protein YjbI with pentapeptide repeats